MFLDKSSSQAHVFRAFLAAVMIVVAAALRIAPHPWNFTPVGAMALFSGAMFRDRRVALLFPLAALFAGDFFIGFHRLMPVVYASFLLNVLIGTWLAERRGIVRVGAAVFLGALQFFLITNLAIWQIFDAYPHTPGGLVAGYLTGLPLFGNTLAGDVFYAALFFGLFALAERLLPVVRESAAHIGA